MKPIDHDARMVRVRTVLEGLSVGDAFGQQFFSAYNRDFHLPRRAIPPGPWKYTDDTAMALAIVETLEHCGSVDQNELARNFAIRYRAEPDRGYGAGAARLLKELNSGGDWREWSRSLFYGEGSYGNGAAMRSAPVGAYFYDDLTVVVKEATRAAEITHAHPEGIAGGVAVAVATAVAFQSPPISSQEFLTMVWKHTPTGRVRDGIARAREFAADEWEHTVAGELGNGSQISAVDTVPFCLWCAAANLRDYPKAMWNSVQVDGDRDTNCAIIGGIVAAIVGAAGMPDEWRRSRESLWLRSDR